MYELAKGTILNGKNKYVVESVLGQGGFGFTYLVSAVIMNQNIPVKTQFAVKEFFLKSHCMRNEQDGCTMTYAEVGQAEVLRCQQDFKAEAGRLVSICEANRKLGNEEALTNHHIVPVNECFDANGTSYFVMEFLNGGSLRSRVKADGVMSEVQALSFIRPIVDAVEFLHRRKILHMDIKPENIVMRSGGDTQADVPMLIDFGISLHFDDKGARTTLSNSSGLTPGYSPMEQAQPITSFDPRIDVYALAATTFYLLTGQDPINSADVNEAYISSSLPEGVSERTRNAIIHAMQPLRQYRTPTAADFLKELAASYTLPVGHIVAGPLDSYRVTRILDDCKGYIRYEARRASENRNTADMHATQSIETAPSIAKQSFILFEQFVNGVSKRGEDYSVTLGHISEEQKQLFTTSVLETTGIESLETLPAMTRGKGGMIEAICFEAAGTTYCVMNSSFKPQSALVKKISSVSDGATQVVTDVARHVKVNMKLIGAIIAAGCIVGAAIVYVPKLVKSMSKQQTELISTEADSVADGVEEMNAVEDNKASTPSQADVKPAAPAQEREPATSVAVPAAKVEKTEAQKAEKPKTEEKKSVASQQSKAADKAEAAKSEKKQSAVTSQSQADKQALALLSRLNAAGTMPSSADMRRLNSLKSSASPDVQRRIEAFNAKWDW